MTRLSALDDAPASPPYVHDWAIVDVETSGLRAAEHRVLSLAVLTLGPDGATREEFATLLDPGCDPGPVHIHGLTAERLRGSPTFDQVADRIAKLLDGRVMVAHNAHFDYAFLAREFARAGARLPVRRRLCTLALNRRIGPPTPDLRLGTLAEHYGVRQRRAHDALDDARVLAGVLRGSLAGAAALGLDLPLVACPPKNGSSAAHPPPTRKMPCAFRCPGRMPQGGPLVQGMKVAFTGETRVPRDELAARAAEAGLNVMTTVSRFTSVLVTNDPGSGSAKARRAPAEGVPVIDEAAFLRLLDDVRPGVRHDEPAPVPAPRPTAEPQRRSGASGGRLAGRRVLVLGGTHPEASAARARIAGLGGAAAVNLSASVTDVVVLPGGERDRRIGRIAALKLPVHDPEWLQADDDGGAPERQASRPAPLVLPMGGVIDLPVTTGATTWTISASWAQQADCEIDVVAFAVDEDGQVPGDENFVFYGAPDDPAAGVRLAIDGPTEQSITVDLAVPPPQIRRIAVAAAIDGAATFGDVGAIEITAGPGVSRALLAQATLDAATTERTLLLAEVYRRGPSWRLRALGQGYDFGLAELARRHGVDVEN
ncbi:DEDDh family exonuclease [Thermomonospora cellulosilytica]|uniref:DNA polymerase-3 subunit epsilon n=1 Tax=Thermomonospora cellulosilytica TaxID=1411118 RepID=A0A7W3R8Y9_9ACTN|nr:DEDDh family exonuclease [Thermomonospora cellulosilytica]MBA9004246.1 DNA polymerase-3 subunit epsilon [Thermomonospora cellulosilytica]